MGWTELEKQDREFRDRVRKSAELLNPMTHEVHDRICRNCAYYIDRFKIGDGQCFCPKLTEEYDDGSGADDCLIYSYLEGGAFLPQPNFGCIHFLKTTDGE